MKPKQPGDPVLDNIARRYIQKMIDAEWAHHLTAKHLGPGASRWDVVVALSDAVRRVLR